jgi:hypothetical protein
VHFLTAGYIPAKQFKTPGNFCLNTASDPPQQQQNEYDQKDQSNSAAGIGSPTLTVAPCGQGSDEQNDQYDYQDNSHGVPPLISIYPLYFPISVLRDPISDTIVWDNSLRFSAKTFIRMMTRIIQMVFATNLPATEKNKS